MENGPVIHDLPLQPNLAESFLFHLIHYRPDLGILWESLAIGLALRTCECQRLEIIQLLKRVGSKFGQSPKDVQESVL